MSFQIRRLKDEAPPSMFQKTVARIRLPLRFLLRRKNVVQEQREKAARRTSLLMRIGIYFLVIVCAVGGLAVGVKALISMEIFQVSQIIDVAGTPLPHDARGATNFLLLGQGNKEHEGADLTDTIMVASVDPHTRSVIMLSVPRDLYLTTSRMGAGRINELYSNFKYWLMANEDMIQSDAEHAAMRELATELSVLLGLDIHHVVKVDFIGFVQAVDALGGLDIDVPEDLYDTQYPGPNYTYETFSVLAGMQHMDGETALKYARSRHSTSDFDRSRRQQDLLQSLAEKAQAERTLTSPSRITELLRIMDAHVATTLTFREMVSLADLASNIDRSNIVSTQLNVEGPGGFLYPPPREDYGGASVLVPTSWDDIRGFIRLLLERRAFFLAKPAIAILNAGAPSGSSRSLGQDLTQYYFHIIEIANYDGPERAISTIVSPSTTKKSAEAIGDILSLPVEISPNTATGTTIQILLGEDYRFRPLSAVLNPVAGTPQP